MTIDEAKDRLNIFDLGRMIYPEWKSGSTCKRPWGEDLHNSFSVYANGHKWKDHAKGEGGDDPDFLSRAYSISREEGIKQFIELA